MKTKDIKQCVEFSAPPHEVYELLMDSRKHSKFTGDKANISRKAGGKFTAFGDYIEGVNIELVPDKKIVQSWHASDWPEGHYSQVTFTFTETSTGTTLTFEQTGVPAEQCDDIEQGWIDYYWTPMKELLEKS
jgi:activator of HSP90 ATPase